MKPEKQNPDHVRCPFCEKPYGFVACRVSKWDKDGKRYEICLNCAVDGKDDHLKKLSTVSQRNSDQAHGTV